MLARVGELDRDALALATPTFVRGLVELDIVPFEFLKAYLKCLKAARIPARDRAFERGEQELTFDLRRRDRFIDGRIISPVTSPATFPARSGINSVARRYSRISRISGAAAAAAASASYAAMTRLRPRARLLLDRLLDERARPGLGERDEIVQRLPMLRLKRSA